MATIKLTQDVCFSRIIKAGKDRAEIRYFITNSDGDDVEIPQFAKAYRRQAIADKIAEAENEIAALSDSKIVSDRKIALAADVTDLSAIIDKIDENVGR